MLTYPLFRVRYSDGRWQLVRQSNPNAPWEVIESYPRPLDPLFRAMLENERDIDALTHD